MLEIRTGSILKKLNEPGLEIDPEVFHKLLASGGVSGDLFGYSVAASGDGTTVVIGVYGKDGQKGSAYIFTKQANGSYLQTQKLAPSEVVAGNNFGYSVAVSGDGSTIVVSAPCDNEKNIQSGTIYIFTKQMNGGYLQTQKLITSDGAAHDYFGWSVAISDDGSTIVGGAYGNWGRGYKSGSAYIFTKQVNGNYLQTQKLVASDGTANDRFGWSVAISADGSTIIVGTPYDDDKGTDSGSVYIFTKQVIGSYLQTQKLVVLDGAAYDYFGWSVTASGDGSTIIVGTPYDDKGTDSGSVYIFTKQVIGSYLQTQKLVVLDGAVSNYFGWSTAIS